MDCPSLCLLSRGKCHFRDCSQFFPPPAGEGIWALSSKVVPGIEGSFPSPGNFGGFLSLKSPLTFLLLQKSQSGLTNALLRSLGAAEPSCATLSHWPWEFWGWDQFQFRASPGHCGWRRAHQEELTNQNRTTGQKDWAEPRSWDGEGSILTSAWTKHPRDWRWPAKWSHSPCDASHNCTRLFISVLTHEEDTKHNQGVIYSARGWFTQPGVIY